jgi:hypothetical protein
MQHKMKLQKCFDCPYNQIHFQEHDKGIELHHICYYNHPEHITFDETVDPDDNEAIVSPEDGSTIAVSQNFHFKPNIPQWCPLPETSDKQKIINKQISKAKH